MQRAYAPIYSYACIIHRLSRAKYCLQLAAMQPLLTLVGLLLLVLAAGHTEALLARHRSHSDAVKVSASSST